ncbi:MFS transporter [Sphingomonas koreensis]|uniref:sugar porter family MFS transporter n=1 Tax=Sphingomonas koreensis TaxID=93064 RepID=UPI0009FBE195|nr:sugar porter family MFS transporter [Sphingomonas koreensis]PJI88498.1 sugar porter (SP) family MFS transporter [Sphingomonas koreensis]RSU55345.1 MFS transporter [Sphingomonas koreensis]RSU63763.1 MFS transporter [Sphingomonas koreensis]
MHSVSASFAGAPDEEARATVAIILSAAGAALGGLLFGFDTAVISGATQALQLQFGLTDAMLGFTVASALIGTVLGSLIAGAPADRFGRKGVMLTVAIAYVVSSLGTGLAPDLNAFLVFRFMGGLAIGAASVVTPIYIAEVSPARFRGRLVAMNQLNIVLGILIAFLSNYIIAGLVQYDVAWRWMFGIVAVPSTIFLLVTLLLPESPRWLAIHGQADRARDVMQRLGFADPRAELARIELAEAREEAAGKPRLFQRSHFTPVACAIAIAMFNQLSGINALLYYAPRIFELAGAGADSALLQSIAVGGTNLVFTVAALFLIDRFGRRPLLFVGSVICAATLLLVGWQLESAKPDGTLILFGLLGFIAAFAMSQGAVIWVFISEVFPSAVRGKGQALGSTTHWVMAAAITWAFPVFAASVGGWVFAFFGAMMLLQLLWTWKFMPETNGIALEDMNLGSARA